MAVAVSLFTVPLTLHYLGPEQYGMLATISSIMSIASFADFGLGSGLLSVISSSHGRSDLLDAQRSVSTACFLLVGVSIVLGAAFGVSFQHVAWPEVFNVTSVSASVNAGSVAATFVSCFLLSLPLTLVARIRLGYQEAYKTSIFDGLGVCLGLVGVLAVIHFKGSVTWFVLAMAGGPLLAMIAHAAVLFGRDRNWLWIRLAHFDWSVGKKLLVLGGMFLVLQLSGSLAFASDNIVVAQTISSQAVAQYSVAAKLFSVSMLLASVSLAPFWPAYGEAIARGDHDWVRRTLSKSLYLVIAISATLAGLLVVAGRPLVTIWVGPQVVPTLALLVSLGVWTVLWSVGTAFAMYLNAAQFLKVQAVCAAVMVPLSILLKVFFARRWGLAGVPWAMTIAYFICVVVPLWILSRQGRLGMPSPRLEGVAGGTPDEPPPRKYSAG